MRKVFGFILILLAIYLAHQGYLRYQTFRTTHADGSSDRSGAGPGSPSSLPGLPLNLEPFLQAAQSKGTATFKICLDYYGPQIEDPRKAWIELDYVVMVSTEDITEAKRVYAEVKARTPKSSPVYERVKRLAKAYE